MSELQICCCSCFRSCPQGKEQVISFLLQQLMYLWTFIMYAPMLCKSDNYTYIIHPLKLCFLEVFSLPLIYPVSFLKCSAQYWNPYFSRGLLMTFKKRNISQLISLCLQIFVVQFQQNHQKNFKQPLYFFYKCKTVFIEMLYALTKTFCFI